MNNGGEVADQMVRDSLQCAEVAVKLAAMGVKGSLDLALAYAKENPKVRGKTNLTRLLREGKELRVISIQTQDLSAFKKHATEYGVLYATVKNKSDQGEKIDIMFKAEDVGKLNRIYERMGYAIPKQVVAERKKAQTRHPSENASRVHGKDFSERNSGKPSVKKTIQRLNQTAKAIGAISREARDIPERNGNVR